MSKLYVQTGRLGDILAILPLLYADHQRTGIRSGLMIAKEFASVLDGCSYVEPIVFDGDYRDLERAVVNARAVSDEVVVTSIHGTPSIPATATTPRFSGTLEKYVYSQVGDYSKADKFFHLTGSFQKEAWAFAGRLHDWDLNLPLVFDRRCPEREIILLDANGFKKQNKKPVLLLAVDGGYTAPFPHAKLLKQLVHSKFGKQYRIIDLPMVEKPAGRVYDLLAVMERSALLITSDSMPLHLAWACRSLPVFALTNDRDAQGNPSLWHGSPWRPNHLWYCRYSDWPARAVEMTEVISSLIHKNSLINYSDAPDTHGVFVKFADGKYMDHALRGSVRIMSGMCGRELHGKPFVKDAIRMGLQRVSKDDSTVCLSRPNVFHTVSVKHMHGTPYFAYRLHKGQHSPIVDLFSAPKSFWKTILPEIPDLLLDNDCLFWSQALWAIFKRHGATDASGACEFVGESK